MVTQIVSPGAIGMARLLPPSEIGAISKLPPIMGSTVMERLAPMRFSVAAPGMDGMAPLPFQLPLAIISQSPRPFQFEEGRSLCTSYRSCAPIWCSISWTTVPIPESSEAMV